MSNRNQKLLRLVQLSILSAIIVIMGFTVLGSIPLGGPIVATIAQVPVVIGAILLGTKAGMILGAVFGATSCLYFTIYAYPTSFVFSPVHAVGMAGGNVWLAVWYAVCALIICFVPRILIGLVSGVIFQKLKNKNKTLGCILAGVAGSLVNTLLVLGGILAFFAAPYYDANVAMGATDALMVIIGTSVLVNGIPEAIVTPILSTAICRPLLAVRKRAEV